MKVLIAEDNPDKLKQIKLFFEVDLLIQESALTIVENKEEAIKVLAFELFDFIVLDMSLPKFSGEDSHIKHLAGKDLLIYLRHRRKNIPTVVLTAHDVFGHHGSQISLNKLREDLNNRFKKFLKGVFAWDVASNTWKDNITKVVEELKN